MTRREFIAGSVVAAASCAVGYPRRGSLGGRRTYGDGFQKPYDFLPVRFTNEQGVSEGAMYDRVSGELFRIKGTGYFLVGPDVGV